MSRTQKNKLIYVAASIEGVNRIEREVVNDNRGHFTRIYCDEELKKIGLKKPICQINYSDTKLKGTVRGMHFQFKPCKEVKIITCLSGSVFDVVVDLRHDSPTFLKWHAEILSEKNKNSLVVPEGCAHGFQTLTDDCKLIYLHTQMYNPSFEGAINPEDPLIGIKWPIPISKMSDKDSGHPLIDETYLGVH